VTNPTPKTNAAAAMSVASGGKILSSDDCKLMRRAMKITAPSAVWYPGTTMRVVGKEVRVQWGWMPIFKAMLVQDNPRRWVTKVGDLVITLPPRDQKIWDKTFGGERVQVTDMWLARRWWEPEPYAWQPIHSEKWPESLPEPLGRPLVSDEPRMTSIGKCAFDATAAAEEMERERQEARNRLDAEEELLFGGRVGDWWRNPSRVIYEPRGKVTREMAEGRLMWAVSWCGAGQMSYREFESYMRLSSPALQAVIAAVYDSVAVDDRMMPRFVPLPQDRADFLEAMRWFTALGEIGPRAYAFDQSNEPLWQLSRRQRVIVWRAGRGPMSYVEIGRQLGVSHTTARNLHRDAIEAAWKVSNAPERVEAPVQALRERNRLHRRQGRDVC
jgi:hypothetical protein